MALNKFNEISTAKYYNQPIRVKAIISGKSVTPYYVPYVVTIKCVSGDKCQDGDCRFADELELTVKATDETILLFIDSPTQAIYSKLRTCFRIGCKVFTYKIKEVQNVERIFISHPVGEDKSLWTGARTSYFIGHAIEVNIPYILRGYSTADPVTQVTTHVFTSATKVESDIESFAITGKLHKELQVFRIDHKNNSQKILDYLLDLYETYAHNVTKIYERFELHLAVDMVFHSVLSFKFDNEYIHKGWVDAIVIGDTRCGKGYVAEHLTKFYGVGEVVGAENCSYAGLVAGLQQYNKHWVVTWGKIPMNDGRLVVIDEASEIKPEEWARFSRIRSEGVAEIVKVQAQITNARTRVLYLANPPYKSISNYSYGIQALLDLVKTPEDIARFDYACIVAHEEVNVEDINKTRGSVKNFYSKEDERNLIMWMWGKGVDDIIFTDEAIDRIYSTAVEFSRRYDYSIPLVQGENVRVKLAKLAICFAGRIYSSNNNGEKIIVDGVHVQAAKTFFNILYQTPANGYFLYSKIRRATLVDNYEDKIEDFTSYIKAYKSGRDICMCLLINNNITTQDLMEHVNIRQDAAVEVISLLLRCSCIVKKYQHYVKTPQFTAWLKEYIS